MFIKLCFKLCLFFVFITHVVRYLFPCLVYKSSCVILSQAGLLEVPAAYQGSLGYFLAQSLLLLNGYSSERLMLTGDPECALCLPNAGS
jgi:nitrate reductase gamma subunit